MGRPARKIHEILPVQRKGKACISYRRKWIVLGDWDKRKDQPTEAALDRLDKLRTLWRTDPNAGCDPDDDPLLISLWSEWLDSPEAPMGRAGDTDRVRRYLFGTAAEPGPHLNTRVSGFGARELKAWQSHLCEVRWPATSKKSNAGKLRLTRDTIMRMVKLVRGCYEWGFVEGKVDQLDAAALTLVKPPMKGKVKEKVKRKGVARDLIDATLPKLTPNIRPAIELLWLTCARPSEILGLRVGDIVRGGIIHTESAIELDLGELDVWATVKREHKTDDTEFDRVIFYGPRCRVVLEPLLADRPADAYLFRPADAVAYQREVQRSLRKLDGYGTYKKRKGEDAERQAGEFYTEATLRNAVKRAAKRAEVAEWTPYQIRHSTFKRVQARFGRDAARVYGGHEVGGATEDYAGADLNKAAEVARAMG